MLPKGTGEWSPDVRASGPSPRYAGTTSAAIGEGTGVGNNQDELTNEQDRAQEPIGRAAASGFLCGVCDTALLVGASECVECGTPIAWEGESAEPEADDDAPVLDLTGGHDDPPATTAAITTPGSAGTKRAAAPAPLPPLETTDPADGVTFRAGGKVTAAGDGPPRSLSPALIGGLAAVLLALVVGGIFIVAKSRSGSDAVAVAPTTVAPVALVPPTTAARTTATTATAATTASGTPTTVDSKAQMCTAVKEYSLADMLSLGKHIVADPPGFLAAYETLLKTSPPELKADIETMGPLTRTAVAAVQSGSVTTTDAMQTWLTNAPRQDLETWVAAQQKVAPILTKTCAGS